MTQGQIDPVDQLETMAEDTAQSTQRPPIFKASTKAIKRLSQRIFGYAKMGSDKLPTVSNIRLDQ
ncbi:MAG: hypothetical protein OEZ02_02920 [Anaerolineae bacterium]|nr:hypothetical protein [Anaerolineae bacterium]